MNKYADAIKVLGKESVDYKELCFEIATFSPSSITRAASNLRIDFEPAWLLDCRNLVVSGQKIEAIKLYRDNTKSSLKEAKEACDKLA
jgi:hypothetical protein